MYENEILKLLPASDEPLSIREVKETLAKKLGKSVSYETVKRDLMSLAAKGQIHSKSMGGGRRTSWIFWIPKAITLEAQAPPRPVNPFDIPIAERDSMNPKRLSQLYDRVLQEYGSIIKERLKKGSRFLVLCDKKIVFSSDRELSDEKVREIEKKHGKVCYVVTEDLIEDSSWTPLTGEDYYPTIEIFIGETDCRVKEVFARGLRVTADFDTGNPDIAAFSDDELNPFKIEESLIMRRAIHLGRYYDYYLLKVKMGICDSSGKRKTIQKTCRSVLLWHDIERNPFLLANPKRRGFVGRDLMTRFPMDVLLSGKTKSSKVYLA